MINEPCSNLFCFYLSYLWLFISMIATNTTYRTNKFGLIVKAPLFELPCKICIINVFCLLNMVIIAKQTHTKMESTHIQGEFF